MCPYPRPLTRRTARRLLSVSFASSLLLLGGCTDKSLEPVAPKWDTDLTLPLANRHYTLGEIVSKNPGSLSANSRNLIYFTNSSALISTSIGDQLSLNPAPTTQGVKLGAFSVTFPSLSTALTAPWLPAGARVPIPDTTVAFSDVSISGGTFSSVTINDGTLRLTIRNHLPVPVTVGTIVLDDGLVDVAAFHFPLPIPPNDSAAATDDMAGKTVSTDLRLSGVSIHVSGSPQPLLIPTGPAFDIAFGAQGLTVSRAVVAQIPSQQLKNNDTTFLNVSDSTVVQQAVIRNGVLNMLLTSHIPMPVRFKFRFPEVYTSTAGAGTTYVDSVLLPGLGSISRQINLSGCEIRSLDGGLVDSLQTISSIWLPGSTVPVTVNDTDRVVVTMTPLSEIIADTVIAVLKPTTVIVNTAVGFNAGDLSSKFDGTLNIPAASLVLDAVGSVGFPMDLNLRLSARNSATGRTVFLDIPPSQRRVGPHGGVVSFDSVAVGGFLSALSGMLPDSLHVRGSVLVNPPDVYDRSVNGTGHIGRNSSIGGTVHLDVPLNVGIVGDAIYADTVSLNDSASNGYREFTDRAPTDQFASGTVSMEVTNATPVAVEVALLWLDQSGRPLAVLPQNGDTLLAASATVDGSGAVTLPALSTSVIRLNAEQVKDFARASFLSKRLTLRTASGHPTVRFLTSDYVDVRVWSVFSATVNK